VKRKAIGEKKKKRRDTPIRRRWGLEGKRYTFTSERQGKSSARAGMSGTEEKNLTQRQKEQKT